MRAADTTPSDAEAGRAGGGSTLTSVVVVAAVVGVPLLVGFLVLAMVAAGVVVIALNAQQASLGCSFDLGVGKGVPLRSNSAAAPLSVKVGSWNADTRNTTDRLTRGVRAVGAAGAGVVGLQEISPTRRRHTIEKALAGTWAFSAGDSVTPIGWRADRYDLLTQGDIVLGPPRLRNGRSNPSSGVPTMPWVQLRDLKTKAIFFVINVQMPAGVESAGRPGGDEERLDRYRSQLKVLLTKVDELAKSGPVLITGDFAVDAKTDGRTKSRTFPYSQAGQHGLHSNWRTLGYPPAGTSRGKYVDYVWASTDQVAPTAQRILGHYGSDHRALLVTLSNARALARLPPDRRTRQVLKEQTDDPGAAFGGYDAIRRQQITNAQLLAEGVRAAGGSGRAVYLTLLAAVGESDLINVPHGDRAGPDSLGLLQQRAPWGTAKQRLNPVWAGAAFMLGPQHRGHGGLLDLPDWEQLPPTVAIHRVQVNADPDHYIKYEARAREIGQQAGIDVDAAVDGQAAMSGADTTNCAGNTPAVTRPVGVGAGHCPLDRLHAPGRANPRDCDAALTYLTEQMNDGSRSWRGMCMALVAVAYGWHASNACRGGTCTAFIGAQQVIAAGRMSTDRTNIPKGAVMWWDGRATGNTAGHVAVYDGAGHILSNDVPVTDGRVGRVPWTYPETHWGQKWLGWSPPYFPHAS